MVTDKTRREAFITQNLGLVHACAGRFRGRGMEDDDVYSAGCVGLIKAYDNFDESRGVCFSTYAVPVILGEIKKLFEADRFRQISGMDKLTSSISLADMMSQYAMYELYNTYPDTYFTPNDLVIVIELNRNLGGFAEFSIPLADVNAYLSMSPTK